MSRTVTNPAEPWRSFAARSTAAESSTADPQLKQIAYFNE
jgi:hypothetical protein